LGRKFLKIFFHLTTSIPPTFSGKSRRRTI
jgi:hypothetical protein